jgi:hypothetical protein
MEWKISLSHEKHDEMAVKIIGYSLDVETQRKSAPA